MFQTGQGFPFKTLGNAEIHNVVAIAEADIITHQRIMQNLCNVLTNLDLWMNDPIYAEFTQDAVVCFGRRLRPDDWHANQFEIDCCQNAGFEVRSHRDHANGAVGQPGFTQCYIITGIHNHSLRQIFCVSGNPAFVDIYADDVIAKSLQFGCNSASEISKADDAKCTVTVLCHYVVRAASITLT